MSHPQSIYKNKMGVSSFSNKGWKLNMGCLGRHEVFESFLYLMDTDLFEEQIHQVDKNFNDVSPLKNQKNCTSLKNHTMAKFSMVNN